jgi:hypothetical protein
MIAATFVTGLMTAIGGAGLLAALALAAWIGAVAVSAIASAADDKDLAAGAR